jgi:predicted metal-dependent peptidase
VTLSAAQLADILALARWNAARAVPYLARGLWACSYVVSEDVPTFAIDDRWRVLVNPAFADECAKDGSLPAALVHEALHQVLRHSQRAKTIDATDHSRWTIAGDCEINARIDEIPALHLPSCGVHAADFRWPPRLAAEEYYRQDQTKEAAKNCCAGGSGAGAPHPAEQGLPKPGEGEGSGKPEGLTEAEGDLVRVSVAAAVREAHAKRPGSIPSGILRWAETYGEAPAVDWRALAAARIRYATETRRGPSPTYARPSRRAAAGGLVLPVYRAPVPRISLVLDTSGSMDQKDLGVALSVVADACLTLGKVTAVACDAAAGDIVEVRHLDDLKEHLRGGGGTDLVKGIERAAEDTPDAIVIVTDGETPWPRHAPDAPCVVILTREPGYCGRPPAWAEVIAAF